MFFIIKFTDESGYHEYTFCMEEYARSYMNTLDCYCELYNVFNWNEHLIYVKDGKRYE